MLCKIFIRTFPSTEECELFESILQTRWSVLIKDVPGVTFDAYRTKQTPNISTVVWQFPDAASQKKIEKLIDENIKKFTTTLSPKTMSFSGERTLHFKS
ncbi:transcriptional regulator [Candidatus Puniceispirillum sp.]|nr:transcriptional regulator [Candidatus Puniceispirillum sp.]